MNNILGIHIFVEKHTTEEVVMLSRREIYESSLCAFRYINVINMSYDKRGEVEEMVFKCVTIYDGGHYIIIYVCDGVRGSRRKRLANELF